MYQLSLEGGYWVWTLFGFRDDAGDRHAYSTLPIFFTAATSRALSSATNFENSGAS
jgi:hypothetical protein